MIRNFFIVLLLPVLASGCNTISERSGVVLDRETEKPIEGVSVEIHLGHLKNNELKNEVVTNKNGEFEIKEERGADVLFSFVKEGYIVFTTTITEPGQEILLERDLELAE